MDHTPSDVETETIHFPKNVQQGRTSQGDVETETIHFTQDVHHPILRENHPKVPPKVPGLQNGEDDPRKEWKVLVTFSVTPVPMEHSSDPPQ